MSKSGKETIAAEIAANIKKKGFILYKKDLNLCCVHFDDTAIGRIMRHINEYVKNPSYTPQKIEFAEQLQYDLFVDGIRENTEEWRDKIVQRRLRYEESKKNNSDNSDKTNNSDNCDKTDNSDKTKKTGIDKKNTSEDNTVQSNQVQSNQVQSNQVQSSQVQSSQTTSNDVSSTQINSNSKKEFNSNNKLFFNKEYTRRYLAEKKMFLKKEAFENFFDYNVSIYWPYKPETAFRRWVKKNPDDEMKPAETKKAPEQPATPAALMPTWQNVINYIIDTSLCTVVQRKSIEKLTLVAMQQTTSGYLVTLGAPSKSTAEVVRDQLKQALKCAFDHFFGALSHMEFVFPGATEMLYLTDEHIDPLAPPKTILMPDRVKALLNYRN